ncbi:MAG: V-type ATPase subunit, partial [Oscillospiraceae bacterium]|nr:V-type ATPase subunit [Oscillospiraceae bacterium]
IHFDKKTTDILSEQINVQADIINIINGYRMKKYFYGDAQSLKEHSLPFHGRLSREKQDEIFEADSPEDYIRRLSKTVYGRLMENLDDNMEGDQFEKELEKLRCSIAKRALQFSENAAVSLYSYMYLAEVEIKNIITVIESIRYGKNIPYMKNLVVQT